MQDSTVLMQHEERTYSEAFIRERFPIIEREGRTLTAVGDYWNQGPCGIAVALCFENDPDEGVYAWKAYLGATVYRANQDQNPRADALMTDKEAAIHARKYGVKLTEVEARRILGQHADVLGTLAYWR